MSDHLPSAGGQLGVKREQIILLYQSAPGAIVSALALSIFMVLVLWDVADRTQILIWAGTLLALSIVRLFQAFYFNRAPQVRNLQFWERNFLVMMLLTGSAWGTLLLFYDPAWPITQQLIVWLSLPGLLTGALVAQSAYYPAFVIFTLPLTVSFMWVLLSLDQAEYSLLLMITVVFFAGTLMIAKRYSRALVDALETKNRLAEVNRQLALMATQDALTGIANRRAFEHQLQREWDRSIRNKTQISLLMVDIDYFKNCNDHFGHEAGDNYLKQLAAVMAEQIHRAGDMVARLGGDEFTLLLPETDKKGAMKVAENIRQAVREVEFMELQFLKKQTTMTVSIGVGCCTPVVGSLPQLLVREADQALYRAKDKGRDCVV